MTPPLPRPTPAAPACARPRALPAAVTGPRRRETLPPAPDGEVDFDRRGTYDVAAIRVAWGCPLISCDSNTPGAGFPAAGRFRCINA